jgi:hypothetical protein
MSAPGGPNMSHHLLFPRNNSTAGDCTDRRAAGWAKSRQARRCCAFLLLLRGAAPLAAQTEAQHPPRTLTIARHDARIRVDGRLDEPIWQQIKPEGGFIQTDPQEGQPVSQPTEVRVFYDADRIYFGFTCREADARGIVGRLDTHDARTFSDSVDVFLDPYGDRRTGYWFSLNVRGVKFDGLLSEASGLDPTWDGIWESATHLEDWGWSAEIAIPFRSIRFQTARPWGLNLSRDIVRRNERACWQIVTRFDGLFRPSKAGTLAGIEGIAPGRNLELVPYASTRVSRGSNPPSAEDERYEGGLDLRWGALKNSTANLTVNPDFADTEADEINITISRFELFFPEKRAFFNEGSTFFSTPLSLFFTRRVGARLPDGQPQRILLGAKFTGKLDKWSLGLLEARTQDQNFTDPADGMRKTAPGANFFVLRAQRDIFRSSSVGFLTVNRDQRAGAIGAVQRVHAADVSIVNGSHFKSSSQFSYNQHSGNSLGGWDRIGFRTSFRYDTDRWATGGGYKFLGKGYDVSAIGFEPETDRHSGFLSVQYKPFVDRAGIRQIFLELNNDFALDTGGQTQDMGNDADLRVQFKNFWSARVRYSYDLVRFHHFGAENCAAPYPCSPAFTRLAPTRIYLIPRIRAFFTTNENRRLFLHYEFTQRKFVQFRERFYGREQVHLATFTARMFGRTKVQFTGTWIREFLLDHTPFQNRRLFITRVHHQFTPRLRARVLGQFSGDRLGRNFSVNSIVAYDFTARSAAIVGYNYQRRTPGLPGDLGNEFFAKLSYLFHF